MPLCAARSTKFQIMDDEDDFRLSVVDVYDIAADIGKEFEKIIDHYGPDVLTSLMPRVITALEQLERVAEKQETSGAVIEELRSTISVLEHQKLGQAEHRQRYARDLEDIERDMREEKQELSARVSELLDENKKLSSCIARSSDDNTPALTDDENSLEAEVSRGAVTRLQDAVEAQREQLHRVQLQLQHQLMENQQLSSQVERLTGANKDLRRRGRQTTQQIRQLVEERAELHVSLQEQQRALAQQQQRLGLAAKECWDLATAPAPSDPSDLSTKLVYDRDDPHRPRFTLTELKDILYQRNELKARLSDLEDELSLYKPADASSGADSKKQYVMRASRVKRHHHRHHHHGSCGRVLWQSAAGCCGGDRGDGGSSRHHNQCCDAGGGSCNNRKVDESTHVSQSSLGESASTRRNSSGERENDCGDGRVSRCGYASPSGTEGVHSYDDSRVLSHNNNRGIAITSCGGSLPLYSKRLSMVRRLLPWYHVILTDKNMKYLVKDENRVLMSSVNGLISGGDQTRSTNAGGALGSGSAAGDCDAGIVGDKETLCDGRTSGNCQVVKFIGADCDISDSELLVCNIITSNNNTSVVNNGGVCHGPHPSALNIDLSNNNTRNNNGNDHVTNNGSSVDITISTLSHGNSNNNDINSTILTAVADEEPLSKASCSYSTNFNTYESGYSPTSTIIRFPLGKHNPEYKRGNLLNLVMDSRESVAGYEKPSGFNNLSRNSSFGRGGVVGEAVPVDAAWEDYCCRAIHSGMCGACGAWDTGDQQTAAVGSGLRSFSASGVDGAVGTNVSSINGVNESGAHQSGVGGDCDRNGVESSSGSVEQLEASASLPERSSDEGHALSVVPKVRCTKCGAAGVLVPMEKVDWSERLGSNLCFDSPASCSKNCINSVSNDVNRGAGVPSTKAGSASKPVLRYRASLPLCNLLDRMNESVSTKAVLTTSSSLEPQTFSNDSVHNINRTIVPLVNEKLAAERHVAIKELDSSVEEVKPYIKTGADGSSKCDYFTRLYTRGDSKTEAQDSDWDNIDRLTGNFHRHDHRNVDSISEADIDRYLRSLDKDELERMSLMDDTVSETRLLEELKVHNKRNNSEDLGSVDCCNKFTGCDSDEVDGTRELNHSNRFSVVGLSSPPPVAAGNDLTDMSSCSSCIPKHEVDNRMNCCTPSVERSCKKCSCITSHASTSVLSSNLGTASSSASVAASNLTCSGDLLNLSLTPDSDLSACNTNSGAPFFCIDCVDLADVACRLHEVMDDSTPASTLPVSFRRQHHHRGTNQHNNNIPAGCYYCQQDNNNSCCCCCCNCHENTSGSSSLTSVDSAIEMRDNGSPFAATTNKDLSGGSSEDGGLSTSTSSSGTTTVAGSPGTSSTSSIPTMESDGENGILDCLERGVALLGVIEQGSEFQALTQVDFGRDLSHLLQRLFGGLFVQGGQRRGVGEVICGLSVLVVLVQAGVTIAAGMLEFLLLGVTE